MSLPQEEVDYMMAHKDDSKQADILVCCVVLATASYVAVIMRIYSRNSGKIHLGMDDWCLVLSLLPLTVYCTMMILLAYRYGLGKHIIFITDLKGLSICIMIAQILYLYFVLCVKFSFLALYARLFPGKGFRNILLGTATVLTCATIAWTICDILQCVPVQKLWEGPLRKGHCINVGAYVLGNGIFNIITDIFIFSLPLPKLWGLQLSRQRKWQLSSIFLLGGCVCVVAIVRLPFLMKVGSSDPSWDDVDGANLSLVEGSVGIVCACLPTYLPLYRKWRGQDSTAQGGPSGYGHGTSRRGFMPSNKPVPRQKLNTSAGDGMSTTFIRLDSLSSKHSTT